MTKTSTLGVLAFAVALVALIAALVKHRGDWRNREALIPGAILLGAVHWIVPISEELQLSFAVLSMLVSGSVIWQLVWGKVR